ncbi:MAG: hypothetical protein ACE5JL_19675 [Dehalococcoidia bacterium]
MAKKFEPEDPMELVGVELPDGDARQTLDDIVQEYLLMGWRSDQILHLFHSPNYAMTHRIYRQEGADSVEARILELAERWQEGWLSAGESDA